MFEINFDVCNANGYPSGENIPTLQPYLIFNFTDRKSRNVDLPDPGMPVRTTKLPKAKETWSSKIGISIVIPFFRPTL